MSAVRVLIVDDEALIRSGLAMLLRGEPGIEAAGEAAEGAQAVALAAQLSPDVVLMDIRMPGLDGIEATRRLIADERLAETTRVLMLTTFEEDEAVYAALRAGASGYLLKHAAPHDLARAVRAVAAGEAWLDAKVAGRVIEAMRSLPGGGLPAPALLERLTPRELEILTLMAHGLSNAEIAARLVISRATVKTHVSRILVKTGSHERSQAVVLAYRSGLLGVPRSG